MYRRHLPKRVFFCVHLTQRDARRGAESPSQIILQDAPEYVSYVAQTMSGVTLRSRIENRCPHYGGVAQQDIGDCCHLVCVGSYGEPGESYQVYVNLGRRS